jgi:hypothetical protein
MPKIVLTPIGPDNVPIKFINHSCSSLELENFVYYLLGKWVSSNDPWSTDFYYITWRNIRRSSWAPLAYKARIEPTTFRLVNPVPYQLIYPTTGMCILQSIQVLWNFNCHLLNQPICIEQCQAISRSPTDFSAFVCVCVCVCVCVWSLWSKSINQYTHPPTSWIQLRIHFTSLQQYFMCHVFHAFVLGTFCFSCL